MLSNTPILLNINNKEVQEVGNYYLPFSTGFEIECDQSESFDDRIFKNIPNIMEVNCSGNEQRFRIPNGIEGLNCLYNISRELKKHCLLNPDSGIHYHIDFTDSFDKITDKAIDKYKDEILSELDTWEYKGTYNSRNVSYSRCWVRLSKVYKTLEYRIGEMTFDYSLLFKRIVHCNHITRNFKNQVEEEHFKANHIESCYEDDIEEVLNSRTIKLNL